MFHYSLRVINEPKMSEIRILNLCHKNTILVDIYRQSLISCAPKIFSCAPKNLHYYSGSTSAPKLKFKL